MTTTQDDPCDKPPVAPARRHIRRGLVLERWRIIAWFRWYHGLANPRFEFEFRLGRPAKQDMPEWISLEGDDDLL